MFLRQTKKPNGKTYLAIVKGYRDPITKKSRNKTILPVGYLEDLYDEYDDPIAHFKALAKQMTVGEKQQNAPLLCEFNLDEKIDTNSTNRKNIGFVILSFFYHQLEINYFWSNRQKTANVEYNLNQVFQALVYLRILYPASKKATYEALDKYFLKVDFKRHDMYRALGVFAPYKEDLILWIHKYVSLIYGRDLSLVFYDVTNYYFEITYEDDFRKKGYSKEGRSTPIIQMGLLMDRNKVPITYELFEGNTNDSITLMPTLHKLKKGFNLGKVIVVADKAMNSGENIAYNIIEGNGYIFSQTIRGASSEVKDYVLDQSDYVKKSDEFKFKSRVIPTYIWVTDINDKRKRVLVDQKQVVYYSEKYAKKARNDREKVIEKTIKLIKKGQTSPPSSAYKYIKQDYLDLETGELLDIKNLNYLDMEKIKEESKYDGYYMICTSELDMDDEEIIGAYRQLWQIEETFKITKSELETRPVHVSLRDHIESHFLTCFVSLVLLRLLELKVDSNEISIKQLIKEMRNMTGTYLDQNYYMFDYYNDNVKILEKAVGLDLSKRFMKLSEINELIASSKKKNE